MPDFWGHTAWFFSSCSSNLRISACWVVAGDQDRCVGLGAEDGGSGTGMWEGERESLINKCSIRGQYPRSFYFSQTNLTRSRTSYRRHKWRHWARSQGTYNRSCSLHPFGWKIMGELPYRTMSGDVFIPVFKVQMQRLCLRIVGYD